MELNMYNNIKILKRNLDEILGFTGVKVSPSTAYFITEDLVVLSSGSVSNIAQIEAVSQKTFSTTVSQGAYLLFNRLSRLDQNYIEVTFYADLYGIDISRSTFESAVYLISSNKRAVKASSVVRELAALQSHSVYYPIVKLIRVVMLSSITIQRALSEILQNGDYSSITLKTFSAKEIGNVMSNIDYLEELVEIGYLSDNYVFPLLRELRKLEFNLKTLRSYL